MGAKSSKNFITTNAVTNVMSGGHWGNTHTHPSLQFAKISWCANIFLQSPENLLPSMWTLQEAAGMSWRYVHARDP